MRTMLWSDKNTFWFSVPTDKNWNPIRIILPEIRAPEKHIETIRLELYTCIYYDKKKKICKNHENRPNICRNTSCFDPECSDTLDKQYENLVASTFIKIKK